ncbi:DUF6056 family protein [Clostridium sp. YIM B02551]|uniref:DUF6056 family protein n=1 Tax=Clostridium sp. YIM B02551 TaxID=2910679 RepID=UPI001EEA714B|nr:DUF6056 family protein [Clostridium sp. YIM B02551]
MKGSTFMNDNYNFSKIIIFKSKKYSVLLALLILMLIVHHYIFLYADDLYYCRDASVGLRNLPHFIYGVLNENGRVWVHLLLLAIVKYNVFLFRIINPIIITLTALLVSKICLDSGVVNKQSTKNFLIATSCASMFFILLPIEVSNTTIYYAACSLNYLVPTAVTIIYAYLLYNDYLKDTDKYKSKWWIVLLAFFAGSSTQQAGMIAIGFTVLITLYFKIFRGKKFSRGLIPYYISVFFGYCFVTYGSFKRALFETNTGKGMDIPLSIDTMLKTNIFEAPAVSYVLIICLCSVFWLYHYSYENRETASRAILLVNKALAYLLTLGTLGYIYFVLYKKYEVHIFAGEGSRMLVRLGFIAFALVFLLSNFYVSFLILLKERYPFITFCCINAFGAQIMLLFVDPRFAGDHRILFPSLLLMSIFIVYSSLKFYSNRLFLAFTLLSITLGAHKLSLAIIASILVILCFIFSIIKINFKPLRFIMILAFLAISLIAFNTTYSGYKVVSYEQVFNMNAIKEYHRNNNEGILKLKKTPPTIYGYNVSNWNDMPYFMKQCYKINEMTVVEYYK